MFRFAPALFLVIAACDNSLAIIDDADELGVTEVTELVPEDEVVDPDEEEDFSMYEGATLEIVYPPSGEFLAWEDVHKFEAVLIDAEGNELDYDEIAWTSNIDESWIRQGARFDEDRIDVGLHDLTARVELPNGNTLAYTVGGVLVQSKFAGTYSGLFTADVLYDGFVLTCSGSALVVIDPYGESGGGNGNCLVSFFGTDLPLDFDFDLDNDNGHLTGDAAADIFGWFQFPFPAEGGIQPGGDGLVVDFGGSVVGFVDVDAVLDAPRVSRDAGL